MCVCVSGIIIPALYSQQITSALYAGVNPGMTARGVDVPQRAASATPQCSGGFVPSNGNKHNETTVPFTPDDPQRPTRITAH